MRPWRDVKCAAVWIFQLLYMFLELFKATLPSTRFRVRNTLRLHPHFRLFTSEVTVSVKTFFFFRTDIWLGTSLSAKKAK